MRCPYCGQSESKVVDSRPADEGNSIRRRRECLSCQKRFTTYETVESLPIIVVKKDGSRESFDRQKVLGGMIRACEKRKVPLSELEAVVDSIEQELFNQVNQLIAAHKGETVLTHTLPVLKELFHLVEENKELCQVLLGQNGDMKFLKKLSDVVQEAFRREWLMMKKDEVTFDYSYAFGALGFVGLLRTWLERDCVEKADDMAVLSDRMIRLGLTSSLQTP